MLKMINCSGMLFTALLLHVAVTAAVNLPSGWAYKGCWVDSTNGRILATEFEDSPSMTIEVCVNGCISSGGYSIAGLEYGSQCYCGNAIIQGGKLASSDSDCSMKCAGSASETCGAGDRMSIYSSQSKVTVYPVAAAQTSGLPGSWHYSGCYTDNQQARSLPYQVQIPNNNNSAASCLSTCSAYGYPVGGMEYGDECYCGDASDLTAAGSTKRPDSECSMACPGAAQYTCGAGSRLSLYTWTGTPLNTFTYTSGNAAGSYKYFVPGLVVPLIILPGINGKFVFVEKAGTSYFGNSTGAYELDPSLASNFGRAWRTLTGIKTDVFCSAGLILPDAAARSVTIGGWSLDSTYGVRFFTPNGKLGTNSTSNWEENSSEIKLQAGRWYPSAMVMTNGSILVVGGETGSNGPPQPSLELLPKAGGTVYLDWLDRTDPYNLYPFLAVLPGGGIFVAYYNEARILNARTFATTKTLPNIPGSVSNALAGRSYPFEGTSMLMPQRAPYTDPLTIMICGGSDSNNNALDNCVTIQPEASNPKWILERMPSRRVMPCIAALPDGTYLIINGAHVGQAGFGLATSPNLNAVLYNPAKPYGSRMSVLANTTIARLYHSEATTMDDGRVLVSGSDPQDKVNPEELRVEVFSPPYTLSGARPPTLALASGTPQSWSYGQTYTVSIAIPSGNRAGIRFSLLGVVASTHGNSMGQRTIFPAFSCSSATSCTVTAPPNANVCPPGWFQLFVLDGAMPGKAVWVRIGGDPARLGSWPNYPDFTKPGS